MTTRPKIRIGAVNYLNTKPLIFGLERIAPWAELVLDFPSRLADNLAAGELDVALIPMDPALAHVSAKFEGEAGLQLVDAGDSVSVDKPPPGIPIKRTITVLPQADGIYTLHAMVTASSDGDSRTTSFAVPVIAGAGLQDPPAKAAATASANAAKTR